MPYKLNGHAGLVFATEIHVYDVEITQNEKYFFSLSILTAGSSIAVNKTCIVKVPYPSLDFRSILQKIWLIFTEVYVIGQKYAEYS